VATKVNRVTVYLSPFPKLVVIYLGMRVNRLTGLKTLIGFGPQIAKSAADKPDGLHSPVLARYGISTSMEPVGAAPAMVEEISSRFGRHGLLA
jgi:hypothetical protein